MFWPFRFVRFGLVLLCWPSLAHASYFQFNENCKKAYALASEANFAQADFILAQERSARPDNLAAVYVEVFASFLNTTFQESPEGDEAFLDWIDEKIDLVKDGDESEFKGFALGELNLFEALVETRAGNMVSGAFSLRRAYLTLEDNLEEYPNFLLPKKGLYTVQALLSNIPQTYKGLVEFFGYETDQYVALRELDALQKSLETDTAYGIFRKEVNLYRGTIMLKLTQKYEEAFNIIRANTSDYSKNPVSCFVRGKLALDSKKTNEAIEVLQHFSGQDCPIPYINYDLGTAYFYKLDSKCPLYFSYFLRQTKGPGLVKDTYLKLAYYAYLKNMPEKVDVWLKYIREHETSNREKDEVAVEEASRFDELDKTLLKVRIHFDGGFYEYALDLLEKDRERLLTKDYTKIRYFYQSARLHQDMNHFPEAIERFEDVVKMPFLEREYFVPVSHYQMGAIYEDKLKNSTKALEAYKKCLGFKNYPYESHYQYKSKLGIKRLES